uniref:2-oxoglutarate and iron-dependent oxygenase domain-containing protein 1 n=1 Tax=Lygus hesperus TaxID=30085 RepID=A0A0A9XRP7_LYGHE
MNPENVKEALDVTLSLLNTPAKQSWDPEVGGTTHYVKSGEEDELLSITPKANTLTLVYRAGAEQREDGLLCFTRYISHQAQGSIYQYCTTCRLDEDTEDDEDDEDDRNEDACD